MKRLDIFLAIVLIIVSVVMYSIITVDLEMFGWSVVIGDIVLVTGLCNKKWLRLEP
jgi:hypothetical protein